MYTIYVSVDDTYCMAVNISLLIYTIYISIDVIYCMAIYTYLLIYTIYISVDDIYCMAIYISLDIYYIYIYWWYILHGYTNISWYILYIYLLMIHNAWVYIYICWHILHCSFCGDMSRFLAAWFIFLAIRLVLSWPVSFLSDISDFFLATCLIFLVWGDSCSSDTTHFLAWGVPQPEWDMSRTWVYIYTYICNVICVCYMYMSRTWVYIYTYVCNEIWKKWDMSPHNEPCSTSPHNEPCRTYRQTYICM